MKELDYYEIYCYENGEKFIVTVIAGKADAKKKLAEYRRNEPHIMWNMMPHKFK